MSVSDLHVSSRPYFVSLFGKRFVKDRVCLLPLVAPAQLLAQLFGAPAYRRVQDTF